MSETNAHPFAQLAAALETVVRPGRFWASGRQVAPLPRVDVAGFGTLPLPLIPQVLDLLGPLAEPAPYGRGGETLIDPDVRRCRQIAASQVDLSDTHWTDTLDAMTATAAQGLGVEGDVEARLYKMLLYEAGDFFVPHRDSEKEPGMFGTLVVVLPSCFTGGDLRVSHRGEIRSLDLVSASPGELAWAAFYADCTHELVAVESGVRAVLVFNLVRAQGGLGAPVRDAEVAEVESALTAWESEGYPPKLCYVLDHHYTPAELGWSALKGQDQGRAFALRDAALRASHTTHLCMVSIEQEWSAEETGWPSYRHRADPGPDEVELYDLIDELRTVGEWVDVEGQHTDAASIPFVDDELCPPQCIEDEEPDEFHYHEATGNEGGTVERTYRRAAVVVWPAAHHVAVIAQGGAGAVAQALSELDPDDPSAGALARDLGDAGIWSLSGDGWRAGLRDLLDELARHRLAEAAGLYIERHAVRDGVDRSIAPALAAMLDLRTSGEAAAAGVAVVERNGHRRLGASAALLQEVVGNSAHPSSTWVAVMQAVVGLVDAEAPVDRWGRANSLVLDHPCLVALVRAAAALPVRAPAARLLGIARARPNRFPFHETVLPAVLELTSATACPDPWREYVIGVLTEHIGRPLEPPQDLRRDPPSCNCEYCEDLAEFLTDPDAAVWDYKVRKEGRKHLYRTLKRERLDAEATTIRKGSPYTWRCRKTTGRYEARVALRRREEEALSKLTASAVEE